MLKQWVDFVRASSFIVSGVVPNITKLRDFTIRFIHAPKLCIFSDFQRSNITQGFPAFIRKMLLDDRIAPFRNVLMTYELLAYLSYRPPKLGRRCIELPITRRYPKGKVPTTISSFRGNYYVLEIPVKTCMGRFNP